MHAYEGLRHISSREFADLGLDFIAYIKPVTIADQPQYAVHSADGSVISVIEDLETAEAAILQSDLYPVSLH